MSQVEVWGTGKPVKGFTEDAVLTAARKGFPKAKAQHIAQFIAGKRFLITRVNDESTAQRLIDGLAKAGIDADTNGPPPTPAGALPSETDAAAAEEPMLLDELTDSAPPPEPARPRSASLKQHWKLIAGAVGILIAVAAAAVLVQHEREKAQELAAQARMQANARDKLAARDKAEADARRQAADDAAAKAKADAEEAQRLEKKEAAVAEIKSAFADGNYPAVIAMSERFEPMYGLDPRVVKLEDDATFTLKEGARRGNFGAILNAPIKGSVRFEALRQWALQVQERAKPEH